MPRGANAGTVRRAGVTPGLSAAPQAEPPRPTEQSTPSHRSLAHRNNTQPMNLSFLYHLGGKIKR